LIDELQKLTDLPDAESDHKCTIDELSYVKLERYIFPRKGKWRRFSEEQEKRILEEQGSNPADSEITPEPAPE